MVCISSLRGQCITDGSYPKAPLSGNRSAA
jgi:hypothetical protein